MINNIYIVCLVFLFVIINTPKPALSKEKYKKIDYVSPAISAINKNNINPVWGFYIDASPGIMTLKINDQASNIWEVESNFAYDFSIGYFYSFHPLARIKAGLGISSYKVSLTGNGDIESSQLVDIDNDNYIESLTLLNTEHYINPTYLTIPLVFEFGNANISRIGYYIDIGFQYSYLISENNETLGSYTTKGNYSQWGLTLVDVPELGYYTEKNLKSELSLKKSVYSVRGSAGITIPISGMLIFKLGVAGCMGLSSIGDSQNQNDADNSISQQTAEFRSNYVYNPLATSNRNKSQGIGIEFGLYICKRVK